MENEKIEMQNTFNEDTIDILVEEGTIENIEEVIDNGNEN